MKIKIDGNYYDGTIGETLMELAKRKQYRHSLTFVIKMD